MNEAIARHRDHLYQPTADGYPEGADQLFRSYYPPIPTNATHFQRPDSYGYARPATVHGWSYSNTFGRWGASVTWPESPDRTHYTYPRPEWINEQEGA